MNRGKQVHLGENKGTYEAPIHQSITQQYLRSFFQLGLYSIFRADIMKSPTTFSLDNFLYK
jgi:hypothetical protein